MNNIYPRLTLSWYCNNEIFDYAVKLYSEQDTIRFSKSDLVMHLEISRISFHFSYVEAAQNASAVVVQMLLISRNGP